MAKLILVRHGQSEWNAKGLWTGHMDIPLTEKGKQEAGHTADVLKGIQFDIAFTSMLKRAQQTLGVILQKLDQQNIQIIKSPALNERDYGVYTGANKWDVEKKLGKEEFQRLRRSWDYPIPKGESLKQVSERVFAFYTHDILPFVKQHKTILIAAHGNSIRALIKHLENIPSDNVASIEVTTGEADVYTLDDEGSVINKERLAVNDTKS